MWGVEPYERASLTAHKDYCTSSYFCYKNPFYMANAKMPCLKFLIETLPRLVGNPEETAL